MALLISTELCQFAAAGDMAPVSRIFHRDLVLNASHFKGESVLFGQRGYKDEIYCFNVHFKHAGNFFAFL